MLKLVCRLLREGWGRGLLSCTQIGCGAATNRKEEPGSLRALGFGMPGSHIDFRERRSRTGIMHAKAATPARSPGVSVQCLNDRPTGHVSKSAENFSLVTTENCALPGYGEGSGTARLSGWPRTLRANRHWSYQRRKLVVPAPRRLRTCVCPLVPSDAGGGCRLPADVR